MRRFTIGFFILAAVLVPLSPVRATVILEDHFNNGVLDPAWSVSLVNASGWTYSESGTNLTVTNIAATTVDPNWGKVLLSRTFSPLADFHVDFDISWDSLGSLFAYQNAYVTLYDSSHNIVAFAGYQDPWRDSTGQKVLVIGAPGIDHDHHGPTYQAPGQYYLSGAYNSPLNGSAEIDITRSGNNIQFYWDNTLLLSGIASALISEIDIQFHYVECNNGGFFGTESVDLVRLTDGAPISEPVPEPATMLLLASGLVGLAGLRKKFKN
jgi:hypothetical protein